MNLNNSQFVYQLTLKIDDGMKLEISDFMPSVQEISMESKPFPQYASCVASCKGLMQELTQKLNEPGEKVFKLGAEVNPILSGQPTLSKDWAEDEIGRFWIYDKSQEGSGAAIVSVAKTSIFSIPKIETRVLN